MHCRIAIYTCSKETYSNLTMINCRMANDWVLNTLQATIASCITQINLTQCTYFSESVCVWWW
jgi:hypothetical protein